jgi:hypothetical protein
MQLEFLDSEQVIFEIDSDGSGIKSIQNVVDPDALLRASAILISVQVETESFKVALSNSLSEGGILMSSRGDSNVLIRGNSIIQNLQLDLGGGANFYIAVLANAIP